ncbi:dihydrodipicolinate synthase family protein [Kitasatospora phosalacinea]|uniref:dihydrodipicolinate synthase family protein n=1 Tax=Kitasatospora phosalacinea TaxID=2065 RepID=UPI0035DC6955
MEIHGANTLLVTPFTATGEVDHDSLRALIDFVLAGGVHGAMALGSSGEFFTLTMPERRDVTRTLIGQVRGRVPVTIGIGADSTANAVELARMAESEGADCLLALPPLYFDRSPQAQELHFGAIAASVTIPVMLYDGAGGVAISASTMARCAERHPNIRYAKQATPEPERVSEIISQAPGVAPLAGDDTLLLAALRRGAVGSATAIGNLAPRTIAALHESHAEGDLGKATALFAEISPLVQVTSAPKVEFIARIKEILAANGVIRSAFVRPPLTPLQPEDVEELLSIVAHLKPTELETAR